VFVALALAYGPHTDLIRRLLGSLTLEAPGFDCVRTVVLGANAVSAETLAVMRDWQKRQPVPVTLLVSDLNVGKYTLMRPMLSLAAESPATHVMWFDDDSYLDPACDRNWWQAVTSAASACTVLGAVHTISQRGNQYAGISAQPWYTGKPVLLDHKFKFATGAWWTAELNFLRQHQYPFLDVYHNGGDSILGELVRQQSGRLGSFAGYYRCWCEACARKPVPRGPVVHVNTGGRRGRRGLGRSAAEEVYPWQFYATSEWCPGPYYKGFSVRVYRHAGIAVD